MIRLEGITSASVEVHVKASPIRVVRCDRNSVTIEYNGKQHILRPGQDFVVDLTVSM